MSDTIPCPEGNHNQRQLPPGMPHPTFNIINATSCLDGGGEFDRLAAAMRGSHVDKDVDLKKAKEQLLDGRVAGDRQFIWQTCHDGENRIKQVATWQWTEHGTEAATTASGPPVTALAAGSPPVLPGLSRLTMIVEVGSELNGHPGIVHGGFTAALFDDLFGWAASAEREAHALDGQCFTANLNVNYRRPVMDNSTYTVEVRAERVEKSKKIYLSATMSDAQGLACAEATALYIVTKPKPSHPPGEQDAG